MAILEILKYPDSRLKKPAEEIEKINDGIRDLAADMLETMYCAPGIGLAATQVGQPVRVAVVDLFSQEEKRNPMVFINPEILEGEGEELLEEGCLSVPDFTCEVKRHCRITVRARKLDGSPIKIQAEGLLARALQHEIDHLNGILFIDRISPLKRHIYRRKARKAREVQRTTS
ncbi:MAG: peptide deformylase [Deltaproteobacteria bacterium]|nr:peptide deformylase [Deltaproteobacteria bacterium]